jgi:hypothetical protein
MSKHDRKTKDVPPRTGGAGAEADDEEVARRAGQEELERRQQAMQDKSLGAPVTGMPGGPKPARR